MQREESDHASFLTESGIDRIEQRESDPLRFVIDAVPERRAFICLCAGSLQEDHSLAEEYPSPRRTPVSILRQG